MKVGEAISRIKNTIKSVKQDAASLTDRYVYSLILKYGKTLMRRQDNLNKILKYNSVWKPLYCVELESVNRVNCGCVDGCDILRTKTELPKLIDGYYGPLIRFVTSVDQSIEVKPTTSLEYEKMIKQKNFKYNNTKYYWYLDGHLYFPNIHWDAVRLECIPEGDISQYNNNNNEYNNGEKDCTYMQDLDCPIPDFLFSEIDNFVYTELQIKLNIPPDNQHDTINIVE